MSWFAAWPPGPPFVRRKPRSGDEAVLPFSIVVLFMSSSCTEEVLRMLRVEDSLMVFVWNYRARCDRFINKLKAIISNKSMTASRRYEWQMIAISSEVMGRGVDFIARCYSPATTLPNKVKGARLMMSWCVREEGCAWGLKSCETLNKLLSEIALIISRLLFHAEKDFNIIFYNFEDYNILRRL